MIGEFENENRNQKPENKKQKTENKKQKIKNKKIKIKKYVLGYQQQIDKETKMLKNMSAN